MSVRGRLGGSRGIGPPPTSLGLGPRLRGWFFRLCRPLVGHVVPLVEPAAEIDLPAAARAKGQSFAAVRREGSTADWAAQFRHVGTFALRGRYSAAFDDPPDFFESDLASVDFAPSFESDLPPSFDSAAAFFL